MSKESENIDRIFRLHEDAQASGKLGRVESQTGTQPGAARSGSTGSMRPGTGTQPAVRPGTQTDVHIEPARESYRLIQPRDDRPTGCLGALMYATFILCVSIILAILAWMAASDALALNKESFTSRVVLPDDIFTVEFTDIKDDDGTVTGHRTVTHADVGYLSKTLKQAGLIEYSWLFELYCGISHADEKVKPGEYELLSTYDYRALIQNMRPNGGGAVTVNVTFPEGLTAEEMFRLLDRSGVCSYDDLVEAAAHYDFRHSFLSGLPTEDEHRLEGFLFPETYNFYVGTTASTAISKLLDQFGTVLTDEMLAALAASPYSLRDVVTVASMIEKEAADDSERAAIASVIYNRITAGMNLGIDSTILYVHPGHTGAPNAAMLVEQSPYNTRLSPGLPPSPICNPGQKSLEAAFFPNMTNYYYYALDTATGRHRFFTNSAEFDAFVATQSY
ncbi:MAG: endolytic transglycosylase MltG [Oscillospiraceae bacterium]|nr:endolytic transglycosylase MltG [Oscillospiraceae bacterium]